MFRRMLWLQDGMLKVSTPEVTDPAREGSGRIIVTVKGYNDVDVTSEFGVMALYRISFEDVDESYLAGPTAYGENLYDGGYTGYLDPNSGLKFNTTVGGYGFSMERQDYRRLSEPVQRILRNRQSGRWRSRQLGDLRGGIQLVVWRRRIHVFRREQGVRDRPSLLHK